MKRLARLKTRRKFTRDAQEQVAVKMSRALDRESCGWPNVLARTTGTGAAMKQSYRLGIDLGTNSLGFCIFDLDKDNQPCGIRRMGVRIFSDGRDPQSKASLAASRRAARGARRRRDRYLKRRERLLAALIHHGLMPKNEVARKALERLNPYKLRAKGLEERLPLHHLGRALFHLNQRRGFKSNRKTERGQDEKAEKESASMKGAAMALEKSLRDGGYRTFGQYLWKAVMKEGRERCPVRARPRQTKSGRNEYELYPTRAMYEAEFDALWQEQAKHHPALTQAMRDEIRKIVFRQRDLLPVDPGHCTLDPAILRAPLALPVVQHFRIYQELANLEIIEIATQKTRRLARAERDRLFDVLKRKRDLSFKAKGGVRKVLGVGAEVTFNLEDERRDKLKGDAVSAQLSSDDCFGPRWFALDEPKQTEIVQSLLDDEEESIVERAQTAWGLDEAAAKALLRVKLPAGYGRLGLETLRKIVPLLKDGVGEDGGLMRYDEAAGKAVAHHSDFRDGEILDELPYYGKILQRYMSPVKSKSAPPEEREFGRIANPTVHIALNQIRRLINALIRKYGHPHEIVVELARDLKISAEERERITKEQGENKKKNDMRRVKLEEIEREHDLVLTGASTIGVNILKLKLWEELNPAECHDRRCVYTGEQISARRLFGDEVEIEHILPFQQSLDDSAANLTISMRYANRIKGNDTPWSAFHAIQHPKIKWDDILLRVANLPKNKQWRFRQDAMDLVRDRTKRALMRERNELPPDVLEDIDRTGGFLARQLVDTAYAARVARQYLWKICDPNLVRVVPGRLTELLRRKWGLNQALYGNKPDPQEGSTAALPKKRDDHRHHAIDAFVVGVTSLSLLQRFSAAADQTRERLFDEVPKPWVGFDREDLRAHLQRMTISYRPDHGRADGATAHGTTGKLHDETAYGIIGPDRRGEDDGDATLVYRKPLASLNANEIERIRDKTLRQKVRDRVGHLLFDDQKIENAKVMLKAARKAKDAVATKAANVEIARLKADRKKAKKDAAKGLKEELTKFAAETGIRRVRLLRTERDFVAVEAPDGRPFKAYSPGDNHRVDIFEKSDGTWDRELIRVYDANQPGFAPKWCLQHPDAQLIASFHKDDLVRLVRDGREQTFRVASIWENYLQLAGHNETNLAERYRTGEFKWVFANYDKLQDEQARKVTVDILGRVSDPGPPKPRVAAAE
jgi:CRISPR-associated endonuclease Csn1